MSSGAKRSRRGAYLEASEQYATLLRQQAQRSMQRLERTRKLKPFDRLMFLYCMYYVDTTNLPDHSLYVQAQRIITDSSSRVSQPALFEHHVPTSILDQVTEECDAEMVQETITELQELADLRNELGNELEHMGDWDDGVDGEDYGGLDVALVDREAPVLAAGVYWQQCAAYLDAKMKSDACVSHLEPHWLSEVETILQEIPSDDLPAVAGDACALLSCTDPAYITPSAATEDGDGEAPTVSCGQSRTKGIDVDLYAMVRCRAQWLYFFRSIKRFDSTFRRDPPSLTSEQRVLQEQLDQKAAALLGSRVRDGGETAIGVAVDFIPDDSYIAETAGKANEGMLQEDEAFFKDEVHDYYLRSAAQQGAKGRRNAHDAQRNNNRNQSNSQAGGVVKPNRFCKVKTGFFWTQYNKTHFTRSSPPPRTVMWYEFTLFYPDLVNNRTINWNRIYRIEDVEAGFNDEYCLLVFSVGPPYADVAYRIVRRQWDTRPGGVRCSIDGKGKFKLFFRFSNSSYKR